MQLNIIIMSCIKTRQNVESLNSHIESHKMKTKILTTAALLISSFSFNADASDSQILRICELLREHMLNNTLKSHFVSLTMLIATQVLNSSNLEL